MDTKEDAQRKPKRSDGESYLDFWLRWGRYLFTGQWREPLWDATEREARGIRVGWKLFGFLALLSVGLAIYFTSKHKDSVIQNLKQEFRDERESRRHAETQLAPFQALSLSKGLPPEMGLGALLEDIKKQSQSLSNVQTALTENSDTLNVVKLAFENSTMENAELRKQIESLTDKFEVKYSFDGVRIIDSGIGIVSYGERDEKVFAAFNKMFEIQSLKDWDHLKKVAEEEMRAQKRWLSPYLFRAVANAQMGKLDYATSDCEYVLKECNGDEQYITETMKLLKFIAEQSKKSKPNKPTGMTEAQ